MTQAEFHLIFEDQVRKCSDTLHNKTKEYTGDNQDRLIAFKVAASLQGCSPQKALVGMMAKHIDYYHAWEPLFSHLRATAIYGIITLESHHYI